MFVCVCHAITDREIVDAADNGVEHVDQLGELCGAGTGCGCCRDVAQDLIDARRGDARRTDARRLEAQTYAA